MEINIEEYYTRYGPMVLRRCRQLLRDEEKALDAMQEVFTKLMISQKRLKGNYPSSLLFRISTNVCLNMIRDHKHHRSIDSDSEDIMIQLGSYDEGEDRLVVRDMLDRLFRKEKQSTREIATLHFVDGMTLQEVADEVGLSLSGVRKRIRELRTRIKIKKEIYNEN
ncbi:MAG: sigma-70 family RNA polymerase sigma factor [Candidatus Aminicenantes bacterium]|jgi:RNA polymerase sigma-70 factor (ECF subfamily)